MDSQFELALRDLAEGADGPSPELLMILSGPTRAESESFAVCWQALDVDRRRAAIARMVELAEERFELDFIALFRECLSDSDPVVRRHAVEGLWEYERADLVEPLARIIREDPDVLVRAMAATSLGRFVYQAECDELDEVRGDCARSVLEETIAKPGEDIEVVRRALESIAYVNDERVREAIDRAYEHEDERMRQSAVFAMGRSADDYWSDIVLEELHASSAAMRYEAVRASGELQLRNGVDRLIALIDDPDTEVQSMAIWALGQIGGKRAQTALERIVEGSGEALASAAAEALDEMEFASYPMDLFVHELGEDSLVGREPAFDDEDDDLEDLDEGLEEEGWHEDFLDL